MHRHLGVVAIALILVVTLIAAWAVWRDASPEPVEPEPITPGEVGTFAIYTNGDYGFAVMYPTTAVLQEASFTSNHLPNSWRVNARPVSVGVPVLAVITYQTESETAYPRHYEAQVRIGASTDETEVERCLEAGVTEGETALPDTMLGETRFKTFAFESAGMMQYVKGISYRTVHEGACVAIEQIATGSSYRDEPSSEDISDTVLTAEYEKLMAVVQSFSFARP
jgi:hypothetical protein